jgi:hypothetical protein
MALMLIYPAFKLALRATIGPFLRLTGKKPIDFGGILVPWRQVGAGKMVCTGY